MESAVQNTNLERERMPEPTSGRSFLNAAVAVLSAAGRPLTADEITAEALARGILQSTGKTPVASMTACLYTHVRDAEHPRVIRVFDPGQQRARRGSVRWTLPPDAYGGA
jgi:hypothetical protein